MQVYNILPLLWQPARLASPGQEQVPVLGLKTKPPGQVIKLAVKIIGKGLLCCSTFFLGAV
jgi:hypothetical protein